MESLESIKKELSEVKKELSLKCEECDKLKLYRNSLESETHDLTASLFEEANKMVQNACKKQHDAESKLKQATQEIEALKIEVATLKALSLKIIDNNSMRKTSEKKEKSPSRYFSRLLQSPSKNRKKPNNLQIDNTASLYCNKSAPSTPCHSDNQPGDFNISQVNTAAYEDFRSWRSNLNRVTCSCLNPSQLSGSSRVNEHVLLRHCTIIQSSPFLKRVYDEDISPCLKFSRDACEDVQRGVQVKDEELRRDLHTGEDDVQNKVEEDLERAIHYNELVIEPVTRIERSKCSLTHIQSICSYRMKLKNEWMMISLYARNRIAKVCDLVTFIRYIRKGIIHYDANRMYNEFVRHQIELSKSRIGHQMM